jgi:hypothetical protein
MSYKTICIDFDGVISHYDGWKGIGIFGEPISGVKESLEHIREMGWQIIIHTTRGEVNHIDGYMKDHGIPYDHINYNPQQFEHMNQGKPIADVYIDDRAIRFTGEWNADLVQEILNFSPWHRKGDYKHEVELRKNLIDLANYVKMTVVLLDGNSPEEGMNKVSVESLAIFKMKNKEYGNSFFNEGLDNAFNDIRRKYKRITQILKQMGIVMPKDTGVIE